MHAVTSYSRVQHLSVAHLPGFVVGYKRPVAAPGQNGLYTGSAAIDAVLVCHFLNKPARRSRILRGDKRELPLNGAAIAAPVAFIERRLLVDPAKSVRVNYGAGRPPTYANADSAGQSRSIEFHVDCSQP